MKKLIVAAAFMLMGLSASAQLQVGGGYKYEFWPVKVKESRGWNRQGTFEMHGIYAGASYNWAMTDFGLSLTPGAYFSLVSGVSSTKNEITGKMEKTRYSTELERVRSGNRSLMLTIPVYVTYSMPIGPGDAFVYGGPSLECGITLKDYERGRQRETTSSPWRSFKELSQNYYSDGIDMRPFDFKVGVGFGYRWEFIQVNLGMDIGMVNRAPKSNAYASYHAHSIHFGAAYIF